MGTTKEYKKIAIVSPYLDVMGGGERYILTIASIFSKDRDVTLFWDERELLQKVKDKLGISLTHINFHNRVSGLFRLVSTLRSFDQLIYTTDGSLFLSPCSRNTLIIQSPAHIPKFTSANRFKLSRFQTILCYSQYVAEFIRRRIHRNAIVLNPPIAVPRFSKKKKENIILSVGRFFPWLHSKRQDILVDVFKKMYESGNLGNWKLILAGSVDKGAQSYYADIKKKASGYPISIINNASFNNLVDLYQTAKIYWHASGFGADLINYPQNAEHFGITTVEAMSYGCVPVVFKAGGQIEIINSSKYGFLWESEGELIKRTLMLIKDNKTLISMSQDAIERSKNFSISEFKKNLMRYVA